MFPRHRKGDRRKEELYWLEPPDPEELAKLPLHRASGFSDATELAEQVRAGGTFLADLEEAGPEAAQRILDFLCGAVWLAGGSIRKLSAWTYLITPPED